MSGGDRHSLRIALALSLALVALAGWAAAAPLSEAQSIAETNAFLAENLGPGDFYFVQLSDTHIGGGAESPEGEFMKQISPTKNFQRALRELAGLNPPPEFIVITGDLTDHGTAEELQRFLKLLPRCGPPIYLVRGNHDRDLGAFLQAMRGQPFFDPQAMAERGFSYVFQRRGVWFVVLDSEEFRPGGPEDEWLSAQLKDLRGKPIIAFSHRQIGAVGNPFVDANREHRQPYGDELRARLVAGGCRYLFVGHAHDNAWVVRDGFNMLVTSSLFYHLQGMFLGANPLYIRLTCLRGGEVRWSALKQLGGKTQLDHPRPQPED